MFKESFEVKTLLPSCKYTTAADDVCELAFGAQELIKSLSMYFG